MFLILHGSWLWIWAGSWKWGEPQAPTHTCLSQSPLTFSPGEEKKEYFLWSRHRTISSISKQWCRWGALLRELFCQISSVVLSVQIINSNEGQKGKMFSESPRTPLHSKCEISVLFHGYQKNSKRIWGRQARCCRDFSRLKPQVKPRWQQHPLGQASRDVVCVSFPYLHRL